MAELRARSTAGARRRFDADAVAAAAALRLAGQRARAAQRHRAADDHGRRATRSPASDLAFLDHGALAAEAARPPAPAALTLHEARDRFERDFILRTLAEQQGNMSRTAEVLGVERSNLYRKMKAFGIAPGAGEEPEDRR